ncbi:hypothetical protein WG922_11090 [Ramlibacter sp. AN1015]|uniref:Spy/CpxP family protein refolding chaperone n=1 Tax=Ramlibacter sp. AN1015 TaxID=3133428 RepID=UPI0030C23593
MLVASLPVAAQHHGAGHGHGQAATTEPATHAAPYAGQEKRDIKALSEQEQRGWLEGQGMGLARAAELNGYPGPMHTRELADSLGLSPEQIAATRELMQRHKAQARALGVRLVDAERQLDAAFRDKRANEADVTRLTHEIGQIQGSIRASHLRTHLAQQRLLSADQIDRYNRLRGYAR